MSRSGGVVATCTVRGCGLGLERGPRVWCCARGHSFDVARSGYVNLLQPGDRRSRVAGDSRAAVEARERLEERGFGGELHAAIERRVAALGLPAGAGVLDVGAGTGLLVGRIAASLGLEGWALELSVPAVERGARRRPELSWVVANADRRLPFTDGSFALLVSSTGPKNPAEFRRVLAVGGTLLLVLPAPDDLVELRAAVQGEGRAIERTERALALFGADFECVGRETVRTRRLLARADVEDLSAATYRGARRRERERLGSIEALETTLAAEILSLAPITARRSA